MKDSPIYMKHPLISGLYAHKSGKKFKYNGVIYKATKHSQIVKSGRRVNSWKLFIKGVCYSPTKITLESWLGLAPAGKRYYARVKNLDENDLNYKNLQWTTKLTKRFSKTNADQVLSKISVKEMKKIYYRLELEPKLTKEQLGKDYGVSGMTILRAVRRYKRTYLGKTK